MPDSCVVAWLLLMSLVVFDDQEKPHGFSAQSRGRIRPRYPRQETQPEQAFGQVWKKFVGTVLFVLQQSIRGQTGSKRRRWTCVVLRFEALRAS